MSYSKYGSSDRRHSSSRRDSSPPHRSRRSPSSPGPSRPPRDDELPESFGRLVPKVEADDDLNILQRMKNSFDNSPLQGLNECIVEKKKIKIWTRNYKEVRGILTGYLVAFDKHWNLILRDVDEVFLKPKKSKTPFLRDLEPNESLPDMPAKVPRQKKTTTEGEPKPPPPEVKAPEKSGDGEQTEKKKKRKKKAKHISGKRAVDQLFIRGDNIVMVCPFEMEDEEEEEEETRQSG